jgi:hypothetical protein
MAERRPLSLGERQPARSLISSPLATRRDSRLCVASAPACRDEEQRSVFGSVLLARRFQNVHPDDHPFLEPITVADLGVRDELAGPRVVDNLVHIDRDRAV